MNRALKCAVAVAIAAASSGAYAQMANVDSGGSDLVLWVQGTNSSGTTATYAFDTGLTITSIFGTSFTGSAGTITKLPGVSDTFSSIGVTPASNAGSLASFMGTYDNNVSWTVEGGFYNNAGGVANNANTKTPGAAEAVLTSAFAGTSNGITTSTLGSFETLLNGWSNSGAGGSSSLNQLVSLFTASGANRSTLGGSWWAADMQHFSIFSNGTSSDAMTALGTAETLYGMTGNGTATAGVQGYSFGTATLSSTGVLTLTKNGGGSVPLPGALWLFGSGLLGLLGVARRRVV